ncbi:hypothetical protein O4H66_17100 [Comamonadaceae bacterium G21597-S1]|nr:hypothetical protein [Comamonadaceae bacterium G21597-S1]
MTNETHDGVVKRVRTGKWLRDVHVRQPEGSSELWVNLEAVNDWCEGKKPAHLHGSAK